ncbi:MAG: STAS domain-containing protein [Verrucomicrobia bacterium]|nr:STAS domain-containing protein [Verrucomicrobiota bacterium]
MNESVEYKVCDGKLFCVFSGKLDTSVATAIEGSIQAKAAEAAMPVVFDLGRSDYVSSAFLRICLKMAKQAPEFSMINVEPSVKKVFMIAGFDRLMKID